MDVKEPSAIRRRRQAASELIRAESVMTLATAGEKGPWSAPVYYVYTNGIFYFFSSPQSTHIRHALKADRTAGSLFSSSDTWQTIRGIQMQGLVKPIRNPALVLEILAAYMDRFPFTRDFFPKDWRLDPRSFLERFKARLYGFAPKEVYYMDNRYGFGSRQQIQL